MSDDSHYEVIPYVCYRNALTGQRASIYGAVPWQNENERQAWSTSEESWTIRNPLTGETGMGKPPFKTYDAACRAALKMGRPSRIGLGD